MILDRSAHLIHPFSALQTWTGYEALAYTPSTTTTVKRAMMRPVLLSTGSAPEQITAAHTHDANPRRGGGEPPGRHNSSCFDRVAIPTYVPARTLRSRTERKGCAAAEVPLVRRKTEAITCRSRGSDCTMQINALGPFKIMRDDADLTPSAPKLRQVCALLALQVNSLVSVDQIIEELWQDRPPNSAMTTLQTYVYQLRKLLAINARPRVLVGAGGKSAGGSNGPEVTLRTHSGGYMLQLDS